MPMAPEAMNQADLEADIMAKLGGKIGDMMGGDGNDFIGSEE